LSAVVDGPSDDLVDGGASPVGLDGPDPPDELDDASPPEVEPSPLPDDPLSPSEPPPSPPDELPPSRPGEPPSRLDFDGPGLAVARRSFLAHPDPLKWIAGAANAFLTGPPPHSGQTVGWSAWTPRRTSNRRPQFAQS